MSPLFGGPKDHGVSLSTSPALGPDGRPADGLPVTGSADASVAPGGCWAALGAGGPPPRPQEAPGTYYRQAYRICTECPGEYEVGWRGRATRVKRPVALPAPAVVLARPGAPRGRQPR